MESLYHALAGAADGAFVIDEEQRIVFWNQAAQEILGYSAEEVVGRACYEILGGRDERGQMVCRHHCYVVATAVTGSPVANYDTYARTRSGEMRWVNVSVLNFSAPEPAGSLIVHLFRDATQHKQEEQFARRVLDAVQRLGQTDLSAVVIAAPASSSGPGLTGREREVLSLLAQGLSTSDIAGSLSISLATARNHIQNILHKLQVHSRVEAVAYAFEYGLVHRE